MSIQNFVKEAKWFLLLALKFDHYVKYVKVNPWALFITHYDVLDVDASYKVSCKSVQWFRRKVHNIYGHGGHLCHVPNIVQLNFILLV